MATIPGSLKYFAYLFFITSIGYHTNYNGRPGGNTGEGKTHLCEMSQKNLKQMDKCNPY